MTTLIRPAFAMHMANELLSVPVAGLTLAVAAIAVLDCGSMRPAGDGRRPLAADGRDGRIRLRRPDDQLHPAGNARHQRPPWRRRAAGDLAGPRRRHRHDGCDPHRPMPAVSGRRTVGPGLQHHQHGRDSLPAWLGALPCRAWPGGQGGGVAAVSCRVARVRRRRYRRRGDGAGRGGCQRRAASAAQPVSRRDDWRPSGHRPVRRRDHLRGRSPTCGAFGPSCWASNRTTRPSRVTGPATAS